MTRKLQTDLKFLDDFYGEDFSHRSLNLVWHELLDAIRSTEEGTFRHA
jgi:hypothetical protein